MDDLCCLPLRFGLGMGGYLARDHGEHERDTFAGLVTLTGSWRLHRHFNLRVNWHRVVTDYNRDTDVILAGLGFLF
ncbi:MAG: hypothetical protein ABR497_08910 [Kiritimatiellia bacterium]|nr:hypothetical protein [Lentisphaerota bacterium]